MIVTEILASTCPATNSPFSRDQQMAFVFCKGDCAIRGFILTVYLGLWSQQISAQISIFSVPETPVVGDDVLLSVRFTRDIWRFTWYKRNDYRIDWILYYDPAFHPTMRINPSYEGWLRGFPNSSMEISRVNTGDSGSYTVVIETESQDLFIMTITIRVSAYLALWSHQISAQIAIFSVPETPVVGDDVLLSVRFTRDIWRFSWYKREDYMNGAILDYGSAFHPSMIINPSYEGRMRAFPNSSMEISRVNTSDSGRYIVEIQTKSGDDFAMTITLTVSEIMGKPSLTASLSQPVEHRDSVTLTCGTFSTILIILWYKESQILPSNERMSLSPDNRTLTISSVSIADSGSYQCEVINLISSMSDPYTLTVYLQPDWTWKIEVGVTCGTGLGAVLLITAAVLFYKKCNNYQRGKTSDKENMFEVHDVSKASPAPYENIIPQNPGGASADILNATTPDSAYLADTLNATTPDSAYMVPIY
ncbi:carcinoembryonic antigen-related cell adhesion molecule 1-like isoform X2 [Rhinatrema bivittatum]|uniref:carcinoembryonic antigen-related cell adhesion molecule 1-like isoform X2 n=1 Tax=Rhinatrema bivittatum TaxID=194408 RepID=UPI00112D8A0D|nr:carcinoembryonic antigen-related cell adhesion molecule 1-like isoform X2 [Rhinatrema bivittatum]